MNYTLAIRFTVLSVVILGLSFACSKPSAPERSEATRVENAALEIALAALPGPFEVAVNEGAQLELSAIGTEGPGTVIFSVEAETAGGINLVAEAEGTQAWFEAQPGGRYFGNLELVTHLGPAFTARGSYREGATEIEELKVFLLHPSPNRLLTVTYRYPPGEGKERMQELAELLGEIEALETSAQEATSAGVEN